MIKPRKQQRQPDTGAAVSDWVVSSQWVTPPFEVMPSPKPRALRRIGTISTLCPRKNMGLLIDDSSGDNALFTIEDLAPADRPSLKQGDQVTFVAVVDVDGLRARQLQRASAEIPPPPSEILMARGWR